MTRSLSYLQLSFLSLLLTTSAQAQDSPNLPSANWRVELVGPTERCRVPKQFLFVVGDAIIGGKISFRGKTYVPKGRIEATLEASVELIRFYQDPKPLVTVVGKADGQWTGKWTSLRKDCSGAARFVPR
jgi:hypothetical protein